MTAISKPPLDQTAIRRFVEAVLLGLYPDYARPGDHYDASAFLVTLADEVGIEYFSAVRRELVTKHHRALREHRITLPLVGDDSGFGQMYARAKPGATVTFLVDGEVETKYRISTPLTFADAMMKKMGSDARRGLLRQHHSDFSREFFAATGSDSYVSSYVLEALPLLAGLIPDGDHDWTDETFDHLMRAVQHRLANTAIHQHLVSGEHLWFISLGQVVYWANRNHRTPESNVLQAWCLDLMAKSERACPHDFEVLYGLLHTRWPGAAEFALRRGSRLHNDDELCAARIRAHAQEDKLEAGRRAYELLAARLKDGEHILFGQSDAAAMALSDGLA